MPVQYYGNQQRLLANQRYVITVNLPGKPLTFSFTSRYDPAYCTVKAVQQEITGMLEAKPDAIGWQIWQVSMELEHKAAEAGVTLPSPPNEVLRAACRYRVVYELLLRAVMGRTLQAGSETKRLRDLTVSLRISRPDADKLLARFRELADRYEAELLERPVLARPFVKAGNTPYPIAGRLF